MSPRLSLLLALIFIATLTASSQTPPIVLHHSDFDSLTPGTTQPDPGHPGQGGWIDAASNAPAYGEIQGAVALGSQALHLHTAAANPAGQQKIDIVRLTPPDLQTSPVMEIRFDFYCASSDTLAVNGYDALVVVSGGPHPGFFLMKIGIRGGFGQPKTTNLAVHLDYYRPEILNNEEIPLMHGQNLAFGAWHQVALGIDEGLGRYVYFEIDGIAEDLSPWTLPRSEVAPNVWQRGALAETLEVQLIPSDVLDASGPTPVLVETDDDFYVDGITLGVRRGGAANSAIAGLDINSASLAFAPGPFFVTVPSSGSISLGWNGPAGMPLVLALGPSNPRAAAVPGLGVVDIGTPPAFGDVAVIFDGTVSPYDLFFTLNNAGIALQYFSLPPLAGGALFTAQGLVVQPIGSSPFGAALTASFVIDVM